MYRIFWTIILLTETELSNIWHYVPFQNALISWFYCACTDSRYPMQEAAKEPINIMKPLPCFQAVIVFCSLKTSFVFLLWIWQLLSFSKEALVFCFIVFQNDCGLSTCTLANSRLAFVCVWLSEARSSWIYYCGGHCQWGILQIVVL